MIPIFHSYFNCTIQELKLMDSSGNEQRWKNFNCTIQELKPSLKSSCSSMNSDFNCTIQELKHVGVRNLY